jgi:hypothetical protein
MSVSLRPVALLHSIPIYYNRFWTGMKHPKLVAFGSAALVVCVALAVVWYMARGAHLELSGSILKVRTAPLD